MKNFEQILKSYSKNIKVNSSTKKEVYAKVFKEDMKDEASFSKALRNFAYLAVLIVFIPSVIFHSGLVGEMSVNDSVEAPVSKYLPNEDDDTTVGNYIQKQFEAEDTATINAQVKVRDDDTLPHAASKENFEDVLTQFGDRAQEYAASIELASKNPMEHWNSIKTLVDDNDGYIVSSKYDSNYSTKANITARIPSSKFDKFLNSLREMDLEVISEDISSVDLQNQLTEAETSIAEIQSKINDLENALKNATNVNERQKLENELASYKSTEIYLKDEIVELNKKASYSTISVSLSEKHSTSLLENVWLDIEETVEFVLKFWVTVILVAFVPTLLVWAGWRTFKSKSNSRAKVSQN